MPRDIVVKKEELINTDGSYVDGGVAIKVEGFKTNPACPDEAQIWLETFEGKTCVHIWNGDSQDPITVLLHEEK